ncbi:hypothetical protein [Roseateles depolymerans]|uniref:Uncharacterized protein n=1 Tax=Roseateles depolymerans TaxID=76731 RepID=A0A0U3N9H2_9BURK|nr:hypothetical protein [Roseateles depolymerans]ALV05184.1 hypothetical protein RD2015_688 [Roseateles depolymerans]REG14800.1 nucleoside diphosphate kinase [Roseateles depolymerans]
MNHRWIRTPDWSQLTHDPQKHRHYPSEFEFRLLWEDLEQTFGINAESSLLDYTVLVLKPECFRRKVSKQVLDYIVENGFTLVDLDIRHITPAEENYIWRYQWNTATVDRLRLLTIKNHGEASAILLLRRPASAHAGVPASVHLASIKGSSAYLERRQATDIRTILEIPNRALTFIHCPDEPADLLREAITLFPKTDRLIDRLREGVDATGHIFDRVMSHELSIAPHGVRFSEVAERRGLSTHTADKRPLDDIRSAFGPIDQETDRWDFVTYAAELIRHDRLDEGPAISTRFLPQILASWSSEPR